MDRNTGANRTPEGLFRDGNPVTGELATALTALWANGLTEEIRNVIVAAGLTPEANDWTQLLAAIPKLHAPGSQIGYARTVTAASDFTTSVIPVDDTPPQASEGKEFSALATSYTPKYESSLLEVQVELCMMLSSPSVGIVSLFRDGGSDAIAACISSGSSESAISLRAIVIAASTTETQFKVRFGPTGGSTPMAEIGARGESHAQLFGSARISTLTIREIRQVE